MGTEVTDKVYLEDGAYAEFTGYSITIFTSNGMSVENQVHLEAHGLRVLFEFAKQKGLIK